VDTPLFSPHHSVLVADSNSYQRRIVRDMLSRVGIKGVVEAVDGAEALSVLAQSRPDLVLVAWDLPILTGEEFVRLVRTPSTSPTPHGPHLGDDCAAHEGRHRACRQLRSERDPCEAIFSRGAVGTP
jgi:PleD family two-component response regulator